MHAVDEHCSLLCFFDCLVLSQCDGIPGTSGIELRALAELDVIYALVKLCWQIVVRVNQDGFRNESCFYRNVVHAI